jgi:tRNA (cmo5U34)-methyltransferase
MSNDFTFAHREEGFDNHIDNSIRGYSILHDDIVNLSRYFVEDETNIVDIGCSTGKTIHTMMKQNIKFAPRAEYVGVEYAEGFEKELNKRKIDIKEEFGDSSGFVDFHLMDIRDYEFKNCSLITSIFTLQFMPLNCRRDVIKKIYEGLNSGGAFIFAEKTLARDARIQEMMTFTYYDYKRQHFTDADILDKERTLRNMLKPMTWEELKNMIVLCGFSFERVQPFWQNHMFLGAIALK